MWLYVQDELTQFPSSFSLKLDCEKLVQEKTEMQRHYVMVSAILFNLKLRRNKCDIEMIKHSFCTVLASPNFALGE